MNYAEHNAFIESLAIAVKTGALSIEGMSPRSQEAVRVRLAQQGYGDAPNLQRLSLQYQREDKARAAVRAKELIAAGYLPYQPKQFVYTAVVRLHLDGCEAGEYPSASQSAQSVAGDKAPKLLAKSPKKYLRKALQENKEHPGMQRIVELVNNSTITAAISGSVSSCLGALAGTHKIARLFERERLERMKEQDQQRMRIQALRHELDAVRSEATLARTDAARANARIDITDQWKTNSVQLYQAGASFSTIAKSVGKGKSTVNDYIRSLINSGMLGV